MKRVFLCVAALAALCVVGCSSQEAEVAKPEDEAIGPEPDVAEVQAPVDAQAPAESPSVTAVGLFPFDVTLPDLEGKPVSMAEFDGKVLIVDFWGTWCPPCRAEIPHFIALQEKYADQGLAIVGINYEVVPPNQVRETISEFVAANGVNYPCLIGDGRTKSQVPGGVPSLPTTLFLDRNGLVRHKLVGLQSPQKLEEIVTTLLAE